MKESIKKFLLKKKNWRKKLQIRIKIYFLKNILDFFTISNYFTYFCILLIILSPTNVLADIQILLFKNNSIFSEIGWHKIILKTTYLFERDKTGSLFFELSLDYWSSPGRI